MRDYSKISSTFWTGKTGKAIRKDKDAQIVALYLMSSPHANMIGVFNCPIGYIQIDTGLSEEGASKGLKRLIELDFCTFDGDLDTVWVHEMAKYQIGDELKETDNQIKGIRKQFENLPEGAIKQGFWDKYHEAFHLHEYKPLTSPSKAPSKPGTGTGAGEEAGLGGNSNQSLKDNLGLKSQPDSTRSSSSSKTIGTRLPIDWVLPKAWGDWALAERKDLTADMIRRESEQFKDHWIANANQKNGKKADWKAAWRTWIRRVPVAKQANGQPSSHSLPWFLTHTGITEKGQELGIALAKDEQPPAYKVRVCLAAGVTEDEYRKACVDNKVNYYPLYPLAKITPQKTERLDTTGKPPLREALKAGASA
jgi:hypothetical protein